jgi:hypothetical protein
MRVKQLIRQLANFKCRLHPAPQNILVGGDVICSRHALDQVEVVYRRIVQLELAGTADGFFDTWVVPEGKDNIDDVARDYGRLRNDVVVEWLTGVSSKHHCWDFDGCF